MMRRKIIFLLGLAGVGVCGAGGVRADVLIFKDGDRVQGTFVRREEGRIVFQSPRFGDLSVSEGEATVEIVSPPAPPVAASLPMEAAPGTHAEETPARFPRRIGRGLVRWWEPWRGRIAVSLDFVTDGREHETIVAEARATREWTSDEVQFEPRYEFRRENTVKTTDVLKGQGYWRHDFNARYFSQYRPIIEWSRVNTTNGGRTPAYILVQQAAGAGVHIFKEEKRELRVGVAENFFNVWLPDTDDANAAHIESFFVEAEFRLPWRMTLTERGVWYFSLRRQGDQGWENEFEFTKKLTEALSLGVRHEYRRNNPDVRITDHERVRFLLGYEF